MILHSIKCYVAVCIVHFVSGAKNRYKYKYRCVGIVVAFTLRYTHSCGIFIYGAAQRSYCTSTDKYLRKHSHARGAQPNQETRSFFETHLCAVHCYRLCKMFTSRARTTTGQEK